MTYYSSSEGPDPALEASWREYRRWRAARRRRHWAAAAGGTAVLTILAALFWPSSVHHDAGAEVAALARFDAPLHDSGHGTVVVATAKPLGTTMPPAPTTETASVPAAASSTPEATTPPAEISLAPPQDPAAPSPPPLVEGSGSSVPPAPADLAPAEPVEGPPPSPKPVETAVHPPAAAKPAAPATRAPHLQLASFRTEAKAQSALEKLRQEQQDLLGKLQPRVERAELADGRVVYRVQTGPLPGVDEARRVCAELHRRRVDCRYMR
jgi:hypothetical protein